ncbi:hypothetical protein HJC23_002048 [Cyclotella cryptica]|uniref:PH domain-containing protein n=1 Tax=Cyclotella cryptica TaxID=29204 RepID=A0ABD3Q6N6_9STRA|eukprot:CCRYP_008274-RA/>CCRYP_008274-RA protein AED:0.14 eAED:0.14 QI:0/-1/0/1/-1/1/1/0/931
MSATMNGGSSTQQQPQPLQPPSNSGAQPVVVTPSELAAMLRKSADIVERNEFHPLLYQTMRVLTAYAGEYAESASANQSHSVHSSGGSVAGRDGSSSNKSRSAFHDVPDSVLDGPSNTSSHSRQAVSGATAAAMRPAGGQFNSAANSAAASSGSSVSTTTTTTTTAVASKSKSSAFILKGIKKGLQKIGEDLFVGEHHHTGKDEMPFDEYAWCDEHFTRGCTCKSRSNKGADNKQDAQPQQSQQPQGTSTVASSNPSEHDKTQPQQTLKPCFQRPINPSSNLIANGWIDQQRRSKMRVVWKDVLASLVEGRRPGEETTLWIQRQVVDPSTGKVTGLEALHQVPMKWLEDVNYVDIYGDHRFTLKVYNIAEEFYFRTRDEQSAQSWVLTLRSARDASLESGRMGNHASASGAKPSTKEVGGMGLNNLDDWDNNSVGGKPQPQQPQVDESNSRPASANSTQTQSPRMTISELRALAHSAGYDTRGMERQDLEKIAVLVRSKQAPSGHAGAAPPAPQQSAQEQETRAQEEAARKRKETEERLAAEQMMKQKEEAEKRRAAAEMEQRRRQEEEAMAELRRRQEEEQRRRQEEEQRRRQEEQHAAELRRKQEEEQRKRQEEERQRQLEQQTAQINMLKQRQEEERRKRVAELQAAEVKRMQEEERRRQQQQQTNYNSDSSAGYRSQQQQYHQQQQQQAHFQQQQQQQQPPPNQQFFNQNIPQGYTHQGFHGHQQTHQQPANQQFYNQNAPYSGPGYPQQAFQGHPQPNPHQQHPQQQQQQQQPPQGTGGQGASAKYMEDKTDELQSATTLQIKRNILIHWALQPPNLNVLRPIDQLVTTIHTAMPPAYGVSAHDYFAKFTPITRQELFTNDSMGNHPDETKLKKAVRKVRVFLHPDKLPRDLSADQSFMARMLWDITSDSWEEFLKHKDELDWIRS